MTATASSSDLGSAPQNTVNGSGLANGVHSTASTAVWVSSATGPQPTWIQYAFDRIYKLTDMHVWNYNVVFEPVLGFGFKDVTIEYSTDGTAWTLLKEAQFARAPGLDGYAANTIVSFGGVGAKFVRLTPKSNWGGILQQFGLSEVRFYYTPVTPRQPVPASGATGVNENGVLSWRPGREAASHQVYFGTDPNAVRNGTAPVKTVADHSFDPGSLEFGKTYYWKVAEVNEAATPKIWEGEVWSFSTRESFVVDDFESYTDAEGSRIYETWVDGWTNSTGSTVGYIQAPFAERTIIHGGKQSMPLDYNNTKSPFYSEAERTLDKPQDWTVNGADTLTVYFRGNPAAFAESAGTITMSGGGTDIWNTADQFRFACKPLTGDGTLDRQGRERGQYRSLGQSRRDDSRESRSRRALRGGVCDARQRRSLPGAVAQWRRRHERHGRGHAGADRPENARLDQGRAQGQQLQLLLLDGWRQVDDDVLEPADDQHDDRHRLHRPGGDQPHCHRHDDGGFLQRLDDRQCHGVLAGAGNRRGPAGQ